jgi:hypothetical protein
MWNFIEDVVEIAVGIMIGDTLLAKAPEIKASFVQGWHAGQAKVQRAKAEATA